MNKSLLTYILITIVIKKQHFVNKCLANNNYKINKVVVLFMKH